MVQLITGHTHLNRHQAIIDETERQQIIQKLGNADDNGNAIIDAPDPKCRKCGLGDETPLHLLTECNAVSTARGHIFGWDDLVGPREIPDFSNLEVHKVVSFFKDIGMDSLTMRPFLQEYIPTHLSGVAKDQGLLDEKKAASKKGDGWLGRYLYRMQ